MSPSMQIAAPPAPRRLAMPEIAASLGDAGRLYLRYLWRWLATTILMAVTIELFMVVPQVGLAFKIAASGILGAQIMAMFLAADHGEKPRPWRVWAAFAKPVGITATLVAGVWLPLAIALVWTVFHDGKIVAATVLSDPGKLSLEAQLHFKMALFAAAMPVTFVAATVVIGRLEGLAAFARALLAARRNPLPVLLLTGCTIAMEATVERLFRHFPDAFGIVVGTLCTLLMVTAMSAWSYALGARIFAADDLPVPVTPMSAPAPVPAAAHEAPR